jgi:hypothetical protein
LDISVAAENQSIDICDLERDIGPITEPEVSSASFLSSTTSFFYVSESISLFCAIHLTLLFRFNFTYQVLATLRPIKHMAICNKYEAQCETTRMLCMLSKRPEIHSYINKFGIVTILVKDLLNTRYSLFVWLPHKHQKGWVRLSIWLWRFVIWTFNHSHRYCQWTRQHAMLALAALSETECCQVRAMTDRCTHRPSSPH